MRKSAGFVTVLALVLAFLQAGCATLLKGSNEQVMITSHPSGANVSINGQQEGTTPYVTNVPSSENLKIEISKAGYQTDTVTDDTSFRWGYEIWSFIEWVIPLGIDMADGAAWGHDQTMVATHLEPVAQSPASTESQASTPAGASENPGTSGSSSTSASPGTSANPNTSANPGTSASPSTPASPGTSPNPAG